MTVAWIVIGAGLVVWGLMHAWLRRNGAGSETLGSVSDQWLSEHRLNRTETPR